MSTGLGCKFVETENGDWFLGLEDDFHRGVYNWEGPFTSEDETDEYLTDNHANPGGFSITHYTAEHPVPAELRSQLAGARKPQTNNNFFMGISRPRW